MDHNMDSSSQSPTQSQQLMIEQQIKLSQLQQLQQLQQQIFQQQMALISGKPSDINLDAIKQATLIAGQSSESSAFQGLPTPAPSGEIRPQHEFMSPMMNGYMEPLPHSMIPTSPTAHQVQRAAQLTLQHQLQELARQQQQIMNGYPPSPASFQQQGGTGGQVPTSPIFRAATHNAEAGSTTMSSPMNLPQSPMHQPTSSHPASPTTFGSGSGQGNAHGGSLNAFEHAMFPGSEHQNQHQHHHHRHSMSGHSNSTSTTGTSTPISAPERIAFNIYNQAPPNAGTIPSLTIDSPLVDGGTSHPGSVGLGHRGSTRNPGRRGSLQTQTSPQQNGLVNPFASNAHHNPNNLDQPPILDQDISPLTSPWLGASPPGPIPTHTSPSRAHPLSSSTNPGSRHKHTSSNGGNTNKRTAPPSDSGDESANQNPRKRQSPAIRPLLTRMGSGPCLEDRNVLEGSEGIGSSEAGGVRHSSPVSMANSENLPPPLTMESVLRGQHRLPPFNPPSSNMANAGSTSPMFSATPSSIGGGGKKTHRTTRSAASTPLMRGVGGPTTRGAASRTNTRHGSGSTASIGTLSEGCVQDTPSPVDLNMDGTHEGGFKDVEGGKESQKDKHRAVESGSERDRRVMPPPPIPPNSNTNNANGSHVDVDSARHMGMDDFSGMMNLDFGMGTMQMQIPQDVNVNDRFDMSVDMSMNMGELGLASPMNTMAMNHMGSVGMAGLQMGSMGEMGSFNMMNLPMEDFGMGSMGFGNENEQRERHQQSLQDASGSVGQVLQGQQTPMQNASGAHQQEPHPSMPVATPASMLNLGRLGRPRLRSESSNSTSRSLSKASGATMATAQAPKEKGKAKDVGISKKKSNSTNFSSPGLKPIRPAGDPNAPIHSPFAGPSTSGTSSSGASSSVAGASSPPVPQGSSESVIRQPKRTHRDAEQRRRNSQKQVIDELRRLLPPISQPTNSSNPDDIPTPTFVFQATHAPLLPGGLPPRGPPKAGSDGPNKNVSKLQVLLCGNEYIKVLTKRVDRRDDEIERLRGEVNRLRTIVEHAGIHDTGQDDFDLERDLDEVERLPMESSGSSRMNEPPGDDGMDEDDEDGDD